MHGSKENGAFNRHPDNTKTLHYLVLWNACHYLFQAIWTKNQLCYIRLHSKLITTMKHEACLTWMLIWNDENDNKMQYWTVNTKHWHNDKAYWITFQMMDYSLCRCFWWQRGNIFQIATTPWYRYNACKLSILSIRWL